LALAVNRAHAMFFPFHYKFVYSKKRLGQWGRIWRTIVIHPIRMQIFIRHSHMGTSLGSRGLIWSKFFASHSLFICFCQQQKRVTYKLFSIFNQNNYNRNKRE
jgi:hypothetical protein